MVLRQLPFSSLEEKVKNVEQGLSKGREAVALDTTDGVSWSILGMPVIQSKVASSFM